MFDRVFKYLYSLIIISVALVLLLLVLPIYVFRYFVGSVIIHCYPAIDKLLTTRSSMFGVDAIYTNPKSTNVVTFIVEGILNLEELREVIRIRLLELKNPNGQLRKPEFQQYVTPFWCFLAWKWDCNFDIRNHIRMYNGRCKLGFTNGTKPVNSDTVLEVSDELISAPFRFKKSPWVAHVIHNYHETGPMSDVPVGPAHTAIIVQAHHSLGDGFSLLKALCCDVADGNAVIYNQIREIPRRSFLRRVGSALNFALLAPYEFVAELRNSTDVNSWHVPEEQLEREMNTAISHVIPMPVFKEIKDLSKVTVTAIILNCFTAAIRKFMTEAGFSVPEVIHCGIPLPAPGHPDKMRNHLTGGIVTLPVGQSDPTIRLQTIEKDLTRLKRSSVPATGFVISKLAGGLFPWMVARLVRNNVVTGMLSSFPGPQSGLTFSNHKILTTNFSVGLYEGSVGMAFNTLSYNGTMRIMAGIDNGIVPKSQLPAKKLIQYFLEELELLKLQAFV